MLALASGERQIDQVVASCFGRRGFLYLTDRRLIFEYSEGLVSKRYFHLGISLSEIQSVNSAHPFLRGGEIVVTTKNANNGFRANSITIQIAMSPEVWMNKINNLMNGMSSRLYSPQPTIIVEREKEVVKIPCKYCKSLVDVFRNNTCPQCGAPIH
jgi:hypothetical protein